MRLTAKYRSRCTCGTWVSPGTSITWDPSTKTTTGCPACKQTGEHPDPSAAGDYDAWLVLGDGGHNGR